MQFLVIAPILVVVAIVMIARREVPRFVPVLMFIAAGVALIASTIVIIPAGHVGVPVLFGKVQDRHLAEGMHLINPLLEVTNMSVRTETYTMARASGEGRILGDDSITVLSKDGLRMPLDITVAYRLLPADAPTVYRRLGENYEDKIIRPSARTSIREAASKFTAQEAYASKRSELTEVTHKALEARIKAMLSKQEGFEGEAFVIQQIMVRNVSLPARLRNAIEEKLSAEQDAQRMEFVLAKEKKEADRKEIEAKGIATFQKIVTGSINDQLLRWKGIEATEEIAKSPNAKVVIIGSGKDGLPIILNAGK